LLDKVREIIKSGWGRSGAGHMLIKRVNPILRGWANYYRHVVSKNIFAKIDYNVWKCLWRWARRRHPQKGARWIKRRYYTNKGSRDWGFHDICTGKGYVLFHIGKLSCTVLRGAGGGNVSCLPTKAAQLTPPPAPT